jgi:GT2 family glycosyltransferase
MDDHSPDYNLMEIPLPNGLLKGRTEQNYGFAGNCNLGAQHAPGDVLLFLNQDCRVYENRPGWLEAMIDVLERPNVGIVGPRLVFGNGAVQSVGGLFDGAKGPYHRDLGWANPFDRRLSLPERVSWTTGAALMIRRADFLKVGGFDMGYQGGYFEDVDLCMKVQTQLGKEVWYCPGATFVHDVGSTGGNPKFMENSRRFHALWDQHIEPDTSFVMVGY